ncbi:type IV pilin-like G/H family protein [Leptolyngbya ohadii]|uniref:type IV pilin-like G/H family protein n=1 Tax=Leptolyngbya ohadii TaxID=1962290 RepID=UPI000B59EBC6|nr:type IV pilin-like G/H family protein [Leptolyngbya ohadii]
MAQSKEIQPKTQPKTQPNLIELSKQGDLDALTRLLNQFLQTHQVTAKIARHDRCFKVLLEGTEVPPPLLAKSLQTGLTRLAIPQIDRLEIYAKQTNASAVTWTKTVLLAPSGNVSPFSGFPVSDSAEISPSPANGAKLPAHDSAQESPNETCPRPYFALALLTTVLAFLPLGIAALLFAKRVQPLYQQQDYEGAKSASETAKILCIVGICLASPFYVAIGFLASGYFIFMAAQEKQTNILLELQAKTTVEAINRSQQVYWLENQQFATSFDQLQLSGGQNDRYRYEFAQVQPDRSIVTAIPSRSGLKSFSGIVYAPPTEIVLPANQFLRTSSLQSAICTADRPIAPDQIQLGGDQILCPATP